MFLRKQIRRVCVALAMPSLVVLSGCGGDDIGPLHPVQGRILRNQAPIKVKSGYVVLKPDVEKGNNTEFEPSGTIDSDGNYVLYTKQRLGAPPGWYKVVVTGAGEAPKPTPGRSTSRPIAKALLAPKYGQAKTTPLSIEVVANPAEGAYDLDVSN